jgi:PAS domain S-box-containing protein
MSVKETKFKLSELRYRRLFETNLDGVLLIDFKTGMIVDVNPYLVKMLGYSKHDFLEKHLWEVGVFKDIAASKENFATLQTKKYVRFENLPLETKYGEEVEVEFVANAYEVDKDNMIIQCNIRDITERVKNKLGLEQAQKLLIDANELSKIGGFSFDTKTFTQKWTIEVFRILEIDLTNEEPKVPKGLKYIAPEYKARANLAIERAIKYGEPYDQEWEIITAKGNHKWVHAIGKANLENGIIVSVSGSFQDITSRKLLEVENEWLASFPIFNPNPIIEIEKNKVIKYINPKAKEIFPDLAIK